METSKDYYFILGILQSAEVGVIKAAYKAMLQVYHPDKFVGKKEDAHARTLDIKEAYGVLSNKISRVSHRKDEVN
jgi:DnaJ-class molecular chaperone